MIKTGKHEISNSKQDPMTKSPNVPSGIDSIGNFGFCSILGLFDSPFVSYFDIRILNFGNNFEVSLEDILR